MAKHTLKILRLPHCKVFKTCFAHFSTLPMKGLMLVVNSLLTDKMANLKTEGIARRYAKTAFSQNMWVSGGKKCSFFGKFGVLCSLVTSVLRFDLLPYYRQIALCIFCESAIQKISANKGVTWNN